VKTSKQLFYPSLEADNTEKALRLMGIEYEKVKLASDILFHFNFL
jgi:hypothetical protein